MKNNVSGMSTDDAGQRIQSVGHTPIIELTFDVGVKKESQVPSQSFSKQQHIKAIVSANRTYSIHSVQNTEEFSLVLEQIKNAGGSQSIDNILIKIEGGVKPLRECIVLETPQDKKNVYGELAKRADLDFRHSSNERVITRLNWPKILIFDPRSENESLVTPEGVAKPKARCLLIATPSLKFQEPDDRQYATATFYRDGLPTKIHWIVPSQLSMAKPMNLGVREQTVKKKPGQLALI